MGLTLEKSGIAERLLETMAILFGKIKVEMFPGSTYEILQKDITKRILDCFNDEPKTASQIANSISFPKDKIYYHIKNLIAFDILYIANKTIAYLFL